MSNSSNNSNTFLTWALALLCLLHHSNEQLKAETAYVSNFDDDTVSIVPQDPHAATRSIKVGDGPISMVASPDNTHVYVANLNSGTVAVIDTWSHSVIKTIPVGKSPIGIAISTDGTRVYVANSASATISVISTVSNAVVRTFATPPSPSALAYHPVRDELWIGFNATGTVLQVRSSKDDKILASIQSGSRLYASGELRFTSNGERAYGTEQCGCCGRFHELSGTIQNGTVAVLRADLFSGGNWASGAAVNPVTGIGYFAQQGHCQSPAKPRISELGGKGRTIALPQAPSNIAVSDDGERIYITLPNSVLVLNADSMSPIMQTPVGHNARSIILVSDDAWSTPSIEVSEVRVCWDSRSDAVYQIETSTEVKGANWRAMGLPLQGTDERMCVIDAVSGTKQLYYRVRKIR